MQKKIQISNFRKFQFKFNLPASYQRVYVSTMLIYAYISENSISKKKNTSTRPVMQQLASTGGSRHLIPRLGLGRPDQHPCKGRDNVWGTIRVTASNTCKRIILPRQARARTHNTGKRIILPRQAPPQRRPTNQRAGNGTNMSKRHRRQRAPSLQVTFWSQAPQEGWSQVKLNMNLTNGRIRINPNPSQPEPNSVTGEKQHPATGCGMRHISRFNSSRVIQ